MLRCITNDLCGECKPCELNSKGNSLTRIEINMSDKNGIFDLRNAIAKMDSGFSFGSKHRTIICDEVQGLTASAQRAWLKDLEEPFKSNILSCHWLLVTSEPEKLDKAIVSRCQKIHLEYPTEEQLVKRLVYIAGKEGLSVTSDMQPLFIDLARSNGGQVRAAITSLELVLPLLLDGDDPNSLISLVKQMAA